MDLYLTFFKLPWGWLSPTLSGSPGAPEMCVPERDNDNWPGQGSFSSYIAPRSLYPAAEFDQLKARSKIQLWEAISREPSVRFCSNLDTRFSDYGRFDWHFIIIGPVATTSFHRVFEVVLIYQRTVIQRDRVSPSSRTVTDKICPKILPI